MMGAIRGLCIGGIASNGMFLGKSLHLGEVGPSIAFGVCLLAHMYFAFLLFKRADEQYVR